jgi:hypothetical protein
MPTNDPVVLELASLPREQAGPFLLLGLDKTADKDTMESHWADRVRRARKNQLKIPLEDVNWARNLLADVEGRLRADSASLNIELSDGLLAQLAGRFGVGGDFGDIRWRPLERPWPMSDEGSAIDLPDANELTAGLVLPEVPDELPAVRFLLEQLATAPLDPWSFELPEAGEPARPSAEELQP